jgi:ADP-ribose pyrophosphatase YjhB (NUDIX family)
MRRFHGPAFYKLDDDPPPRGEGRTTSYLQSLRQSVGHQKIIMTGSVACINDQQGRVLLQKRKDNREWSFPGGGQEIGESATDTVRREVREEMGLDIKPQRLIGIYTAPEFDKRYPNGDQAQTFTSFFECSCVGGEMMVQDDEVHDAGWFDTGDLPPLQRCCAVKMRDAILR